MKNNQSSIVNRQLRIVFFGTPDFVSPALLILKKNFNVITVIRNNKQFDSIINNQSSIINNVDFFVVASFGQILPSKLLNIPKIASINIHPSLLPLYRGPSPIQTAILNGDKKTGITFIRMDEKMDHGPIIEQFEEEILPTDTFESLANRLFQKAARKLPAVITRYNNIKLKIQDESKATYTKLLTKRDGFIDSSITNHNSPLINRMIRAYYPWPGVWTKYNLSNKEVIIKFLPDQKIQVEGKTPMDYIDFINGYEKGKELLSKINLNA